MSAVTAVELLTRAADGFRTGRIPWGRGFFLDPGEGCRCALGGIAWAADPDDLDGDPRWVNPHVRQAAQQAMQLLGEYLVGELDGALCTDSGVPWVQGEPDWIETVGGWNDDEGRTLAEVIAALDGAAALAARTAVTA